MTDISLCMKYLSKKILFKYAIWLIVLLMFSSNVLCYSINSDDQNPRSYKDVKIIMISRMYDSVEIEGYHSLNEGSGYDDKIILQESNKIRLFGLFIIYNETGTLEYSNAGGWIHSKIEIFGYDGYMSGQHNNHHVLMFGDCEMVTIISYR